MLEWISLIQDGKVVVIEIDEDHNFGYGVSCDVARKCKLYEAWCLEGNSLPVRIIRYNPDAFKVDGKTKRTTKAKREELLLQAISDATKRDGEGLQIQYMFYDIQDGQPVILADEGFTLAECVISSIF